MNNSGGWMGGGVWFWPVGCLLVVGVLVFIVIRLTKKGSGDIPTSLAAQVEDE